MSPFAPPGYCIIFLYMIPSESQYIQKQYGKSPGLDSSHLLPFPVSQWYREAFGLLTVAGAALACTKFLIKLF